jgi:GNAT superfamily N-acetyltransferase
MPSDVIISQVTELPVGVDPLLQASLTEGFRFVQLLRDEWISGVNRFDAPGEAFFVAHHGDSLAGVCGLNRDPYSSDPGVGRLRRLYVAKPFRQQGVARALVLHALSFARQHFAVVRVRGATREADVFYRALGFSPVLSPPDATHELQLPRRPAA